MSRIGVAVAAVVVSAGVLSVPAQAVSLTPQSADPRQVAVCAVLDDNPVTTNVWTIGEALMRQGMSPEDAGELIGRSVIDEFPRHIPLLKRFIEQYG